MEKKQNPFVEDALKSLQLKKQPVQQTIPTEEIPPANLVEEKAPVSTPEDKPKQVELIQPNISKEDVSVPLPVEKKAAEITPEQSKVASEDKEYQASSTTTEEYKKAPAPTRPKVLDELSELRKGMEVELAASAQQGVDAEKRQGNIAAIAAVTDGLTSLANLVGTANYAPNVDQSSSLSAVMKQVEKGKAERAALSSRIKARIDKLDGDKRSTALAYWKRLNDYNVLTNKEYNAFARKKMELEAKKQAAKNGTSDKMEMKKLELAAKKEQQEAKIKADAKNQASKERIAAEREKTKRGDIRYNQYKKPTSTTKDRTNHAKYLKETYGPTIDVPMQEGDESVTYRIGSQQIEGTAPSTSKNIENELVQKRDAEIADLANNPEYVALVDQYNEEEGTSFGSIIELNDADPYIFNDPDALDRFQADIESVNNKWQPDIAKAQSIARGGANSVAAFQELIPVSEVAQNTVKQWNEVYEGDRNITSQATNTTSQKTSTKPTGSLLPGKKKKGSLLPQ